MRNSLFDQLPEFPVALPDDELQLLARLPEWDTTMEIDHEEYPAARRLEKRRLIKIQRQLMDPAGTVLTWFAGKLPSAGVRDAFGQSVDDGGKNG